MRTDGFVTVGEGISWAKSNPGALKGPTPENTLYIDASKLDFGNLVVSDFGVVGSPVPQNLLNEGNLIASVGNEKLRATVYALGRVDMQLNDRGTRSVSVISNRATDYDWNPGGGFLRNTLIQSELVRAGLDSSHGFRAFYYGSAILNVPQKPLVPQFPRGPKL